LDNFSPMLDELT